MAYHLVLTEKELENIRIKHATMIPDYNCECFSNFPSFHDHMVTYGGSLYTGLLLDERCEKFIQSFNKEMSNIQIVIKFSKQLSKFSNSEWYVDHMISDRLLETRIKIAERIKLYILEVKFNPEYSRRSRYHLYVPLVQLVRTYSPMYRYESHYKMALRSEPTLESLLANHAEYGGKIEYGAWCRRGVPVKLFKMLNDFRLINSISRSMEFDRYYATELFDQLRVTIKKWIKKEVQNGDIYL